MWTRTTVGYIVLPCAFGHPISTPSEHRKGQTVRTRKTPKTLFSLVSALALASASIVLTAVPASATGSTVSSTADAGAGSLRQAIIDANSDAAADVITITATGTITLASDLPLITEPVTITGPGSTLLTIDGGGFDAINANAATSLTISGITIENAGTSSSSAGIDTVDTSVTLDDVTVESSYEGATVDGGNLKVTNSRFEGNSNDGVHLSPTDLGSSFDNTSFVNNDDDGLWVELEKSTDLTVTNSTASGNGDDGIDINAIETSAVVMTDTAADHSGDYGFELDFADDATGTFTRTTATFNDNDGINIDLDNRSVVSFTTTVSNDNDSDGLEANSNKHAKFTVTDFTGARNDADGFDVSAYTGGTVTATNVTVSESGDNGVEVESTGIAGTGPFSQVTLNDVNSTSSTTSGIDFYVTHGANASLTSSTVSANPKRGITIDGDAANSADSVISIAKSTVRNNGDSSKNGGGIAIVNTHELTVNITDSTISGNLGRQGGGVYARYSTDSTSNVSIINSTISGNSGEIGGGAYLRSNAGAQVSILNSTVTNNTTTTATTSPSAVYLAGTTNVIRNSIIAGNGVSDLDLAQGTALTVNYSLVKIPEAGAAADLSSGTGNVVGVDPGLGTLADNGGTTFTHLPNSNSPAVDAGDPAYSGLSSDQRGQSRVVTRLDMGAVELQPALAATGSDAALPLAGGGAILLALGFLLVAARRRLASR